jgi:16S rRNA processing protein RimM
VEEFEKVSKSQAIMKLEFIESLDDARKLTGCIIFLDDQMKKSRSPRNYDQQDIVGFQAYDQSGRSLGFVTGYISDAMNPLLLIDHRGKEILIPAAEEIILFIDYKSKLIRIDMPEGLTDL